MLKKLYKSLIFSLLLLNLFIIPIQAQNTEEVELDNMTEIIDPALKLDLSTEGQEYPSKLFKVTLKIMSEIDSGKTGVEWVYPEELFEISGEKVDQITVTEGNTVTIEKYFTPRKSAVSKIAGLNKSVEIGVAVKALVPGRTYISSTSFDIQFNSFMEKLPLDENYETKQFLHNLSMSMTNIGVVLLLVSILTFVILKFIEYINTEIIEV